MGPVPFPEVTTALLSAALVALFLVGIVKGIAGFAGGLLSVPLLTQLFGPELAIAALSVPLWLVNVQLIVSSGVPWAFLRERRWVVIVAAAAAVVGVVGLLALPRALVLLAIGGYIAAFLLSRYADPGTNRLEGVPGAGILAGAVGGLVTGAMLIGGPVFVSYLHATETDRDVFIAALGLLFFLTMGIRLLPMYALGAFGSAEVVLGLVLLVPFAVGVAAGGFVRGRVHRRSFERVVEGLLLVIAVKLLYDGSALLA